MINNNIQLTGTLSISVYNSSGVETQRQEIKNLVVDAGKNLIANRLKADTSPAISHMAVGTDATVASVGQATLVAEVARVANTSAIVTANAVAYTATFGAGVGTGTLLEAGLFNDATTGTMLSRTASINVVKGASDTLTIVWTITVT